MSRSPAEVVAALGRHDTSTVSDALDRLGRPGASLGILPISPTLRAAGRAFTIRYGPMGAEGGTVGDYIDDVEPGSIVVLDNGGRLDCTVWGDILTTVASLRGVGGTIINGVCRDVSRSLELGYPLFSRGRAMVTGKDRVRVVEIGGEVSLGTVALRPGDVVIGDADGVVVVDDRWTGEVLEVADGIAAAEDRIRAAVQDGTGLAEARRANGYFALQSRVGG
jgi:4-hydroxy-4-methyl-2-oxoglutarate aldolase